MYQYTKDKLFRYGIPVAVTMASGSRRESISYHGHDFIELVFVVGGSTINTMRFSSEKEVSYALIPGDVFAILPGEAHAYTESRNVLYYNVMFDFNFVASSLQALNQLPSYQALFAPHCIRNKIHLILHERKALERLLQLIVSELFSQKQGYAELVRAALIEVLVMVLRHDSISAADLPRNYSGIAQCIALMETYPEKSHSVSELAKESCMSPSLFYARFKEATGMSPNEYLIALRLANASEKLLESNAIISEIAFGCGFCDSNHFIKAFKKYHGLTPGKFRKQFLDRTLL